MSEIMSDAQICLYLRGGGAQFPVPQLAASRIEALTARLATAEADRDAALARAEAALAERNKAEEWLKMAKSNTADYERVVMGMGRREATAAIVADMRERGAAWPRETSHALILANRYERGDHLPSAGDAGEGK